MSETSVEAGEGKLAGRKQSRGCAEDRIDLGLQKRERMNGELR